jgi:CsoR family transcriptional regulator, copper-sensing transcriptional repressor
MNSSTKADVLLRLKGIEGHIRGIQKMVEEDRYCVEVLKQTAAIKGALDRLDQAILANHLDTCVTTAIRSDDSTERERVISELLDLFQGQVTGKWGRVARVEQASCH